MCDNSLIGKSGKRRNKWAGPEKDFNGEHNDPETLMRVKNPASAGLHVPPVGSGSPETPGPKPGSSRNKDRLIFVIHKHAARTLHYDLRLELEGVLKSWAVPKGPSLNPSVKRLAIMVEDHPLDYKDFEGAIPDGNYGAGNVIIWDRGFYHHPSAKDEKENEKLLLGGLRKGDMKFVLEGEKLQGEFALVKMGRDEKSWLLLKKKDRHAIRSDVLAENRSVVSNKTIEDIAEAGLKKKHGRY